jgi:hypothetical protein
MKSGDFVIFKFTDRTRSLGIAGGPGRITDIDGDKIKALYTDHIFGPAGPYELSRSDVEEIDDD